MQDCRNFYINGQWVSPIEAYDLPVENPATEKTIATISRGSAADVDNAVAAARGAFVQFSQSSRETRLTLLDNLLAIYMDRYEEMVQAIHLEMGAPIDFARNEQADSGRGHLQSAIDALRHFHFEQTIENSTRFRTSCGASSRMSLPASSGARRCARKSRCHSPSGLPNAALVADSTSAWTRAGKRTSKS